MQRVAGASRTDLEQLLRQRVDRRARRASALRRTKWNQAAIGMHSRASGRRASIASSTVPKMRKGSFCEPSHAICDSRCRSAGLRKRRSTARCKPADPGRAARRRSARCPRASGCARTMRDADRASPAPPSRGRPASPGRRATNARRSAGAAWRARSPRRRSVIVTPTLPSRAAVRACRLRSPIA